MNKINFKQPGGFPLDTNVLDFMQESYMIFNALASLAGPLTIISGCEDKGSSITDGVVCVEGEVFKFRGGAKQATVFLKEEKTKLPFESGNSYEVENHRYITFGTSYKKSWKWKDFNRVSNLKDISKFCKSLEDEKVDGKDLTSLAMKVKVLEDRLTKSMPIGLVAIWDRPAKEIPEGWVEHTEMRGRVPVGQDKNDGDFMLLGRMLGEKRHRLTIDEMPSHRHGDSSIYKHFVAKASHIYHSSTSATDNDSYKDTEIAISKLDFSRSEEQERGNDKLHNNIQPSRIVRFIRFVGF